MNESGVHLGSISGNKVGNDKEADIVAGIRTFLVVSTYCHLLFDYRTQRYEYGTFGYE